MKKILFYIALIVLPTWLSGQEYLTGLGHNPVIADHLLQTKKAAQEKSYFLRYAPVKLPFFDNFSDITIYPDTSLWIDNEAYINAHFPYYPVDYGVATLDVLNARGNIYPNASPFTFIADHLTSKPIRLDALFDENGDSIRPITPTDSVYLSFYYQPQGRGDMPSDQDSLVLEFGYYTADTITSPTDTTITYDTVFSHYDSVWVYGFEYDMSNYDGKFLPPNSFIEPPPGCDDITYQLQDTFYFEDSLRIPCDSVYVLDTDWQFVWSATGDTLEDFIEENDVFFKQVRIPITDTAWLVEDFQFRFRTFSSIASINSWQSNTDHWHIDRVYLDLNRNMNDHYTREVSFVEDPPGFIEGFSAMTAKQYQQNISGLKKDTLPVFVNNLDSVQHNYTYSYYVENLNGSFTYGSDPVTESLAPLAQQDVDDYGPFVEAPVKLYYSSATEGDYYQISHMVYDNDSSEVRDTIVTYQEFSNYLAYDDGTAEAGYGLSPGIAQLAIKYRSETVDTLWGAQLYFNKTVADNNDRLFHLTVWSDNNGIPGNIIYQEKNVRPVFTDGFNRFYDLVFTHPDSVRLGIQSFYIGWVQTTNHNLNVGFDRNTNSRNKNFYNVLGTWVKSSFEGSIMIRPLIGTPKVDIPEDSTGKSYKKLVIRPNPPKEKHEVFIDLPAVYINNPELMQYLTLKISDLYGRILYDGPYINKINTFEYKSGLYIVTLFDNAYNRHFSGKLLIVN